jgi:adenylate cyclase
VSKPESPPERRHAAVLNVELRNFTRLSEVLPPAKVLELANDFFSLVAIAVTANRGKVLSVQNDMLLGAFATGEPGAYCGHALKAARDIQREFGPMADEWKTSFGLPAAVSSALHVGEAVFGMAGPIAHQQFAAFGDCVSIADRLVHRARNGEIVLSADFMKALGPAAESLGAEEMPPIELPRRPPIVFYGLLRETRLDFT